MKARVVSKPGPQMVLFTDLQPGDFLVAVATGNIGVKTVSGDILWVYYTTQYRNSSPRTGHLTHARDITPGKRYAVPSDVVITL